MVFGYENKNPFEHIICNLFCTNMYLDLGVG